MKYKLETAEFTGYFDTLMDLLDFMNKADTAAKWVLSDEETGDILMTGRGDYGQDT